MFLRLRFTIRPFITRCRRPLRFIRFLMNIMKNTASAGLGHMELRMDMWRRNVPKLLGKNPEELNIITCHLGNGSSITAVKGGRCLDTSMGFTPLAGVMMGTRCGDIDPAVAMYLMKKENLSLDEMSDIMNKKSGVFGVSGVSSDFRDLEAAADQGNERCRLALQMFAYQVVKYVGAYTAAMGGVDAIVFTAGIGENNPLIRRDVASALSFMGVRLDEEKNKVRGQTQVISTPDSSVTLCVIPTNEELAIARQTLEVISR